VHSYDSGNIDNAESEMGNIVHSVVIDILETYGPRNLTDEEIAELAKKVKNDYSGDIQESMHTITQMCEKMETDFEDVETQKEEWEEQCTSQEEEITALQNENEELLLVASVLSRE